MFKAQNLQHKGHLIRFYIWSAAVLAAMKLRRRLLRHLRNGARQFIFLNPALSLHLCAFFGFPSSRANLNERNNGGFIGSV